MNGKTSKAQFIDNVQNLFVDYLKKKDAILDDDLVIDEQTRKDLIRAEQFFIKELAAMLINEEIKELQYENELIESELVDLKKAFDHNTKKIEFLK